MVSFGCRAAGLWVLRIMARLGGVKAVGKESQRGGQGAQRRSKVRRLPGPVSGRLAQAPCSQEEVAGWRRNPAQQLGGGEAWSLDEPGREVNWP